MSTEQRRFSYLSHLECSRCGRRHDAFLVQNLCRSCAAPLLARYDLEALSSAGQLRDEIQRRSSTLWRYHELLPVARPENVLTLGEGMTPLLRLAALAGELGLGRVWLKDEGLLPTGSFKARGAAVGVARAAELGVTRIALPTNGNAGAAWSSYAARAGLDALVVMPEDAPPITRAELSATGAEAYLVDGLISDAGAIVAEAVRTEGWFDASTLKEPYRIEGKKTILLELVEQLAWRTPDVVVFPTGGGVGLIGVYKGLLELRELGWIGRELPRLVSVQAEGCAPIVSAFRQGKQHAEPWADAKTVAFGINVAKPLGDFLILDALAATGGSAVAVSDAELLDAQARCAAEEGIFICPEGAAGLAALRPLRESGWLLEKDEVVIVNTGSGLKYPQTVDCELPVLAPHEWPPRRRQRAGGESPIR